MACGSRQQDTKSGLPKGKWNTQLYSTQVKQHWPQEGMHILAQYDEDSVVVYQAYQPQIADYAVEHQW